MIEKLAFSVPGINNSSIPIEGAQGMPSGSENVQIAITWGLTLIFIAAGLAALAFLIWGGISWIMSGGEKEKIQEARNKIVYALVGLAIIFSSYLIVNTVGGLFGIDSFTLTAPSTQCQGTPPSCGIHNDYICNLNTRQWECTGGK